MKADFTKLSFLDLPAEIRNHIYSFALVDPEPILLPYAYQHRFPSEPGLLAVNRWIRAEATPIFYGGNTWQAPSLPAAQQFLKHLSAANIARLRRFRPIDLALPREADAIHWRWFDALRANINRLVLAYGKGSLKADAVFVPVIRGGKEIRWRCVGELELFDVVDADKKWMIEWKEELLVVPTHDDYNSTDPA